MQRMQRVRTEASNEEKFESQFGETGVAAGQERLKTHPEFSIDRAIDNYVHTYIYFSSSADICSQITRIFAEVHQLQGFGLGRFQQALFMGQLLRGYPEPQLL